MRIGVDILCYIPIYVCGTRVREVLKRNEECLARRNADAHDRQFARQVRAYKKRARVLCVPFRRCYTKHVLIWLDLIFGVANHQLDVYMYMFTCVM